MPAKTYLCQAKRIHIVMVDAHTYCPNAERLAHLCAHLAAVLLSHHQHAVPVSICSSITVWLRWQLAACCCIICCWWRRSCTAVAGSSSSSAHERTLWLWVQEGQQQLYEVQVLLFY
jgi:hypothetical protein